MPSPRGNRGYSSSGREGRQGRWGIIVALSVLAALVALLAGGMWLARTASIPTDPLTLCRQDQPPPVVAIVVVDVTDGLTATEQSQVLGEVVRLRDALPRFGLLEIHALGREALNPEAPRVSLCNPGRGSDMNELYQNPRLAEQKWESEFSFRLKETLEEVVSGEVSDQSLILEAVKAISLTRLAQPEFDGVDKRLVLVSDLLQHSPGTYSHYTSQPEYESFSDTPSGAAARTNLHGVQVELHYIERPRTAGLQGAEHLQFWVSHFERNGGVVARVKKIIGD